MTNVVLDRKLVESPVSAERTLISGGPPSNTLPPELTAAAGRRLAEVALVYATVYIAQFVVGDVINAAASSQHQAHGPEAPWGMFTAFFSAVSLLVAWLATRARLQTAWLQDIGLVYMVFAAVGIEWGLLWIDHRVPIEQLGLSWTVVWLAMYPLVVPTSPGKTIVAALISAGIRPLLLLILVARGRDMPDPGQWTLVLFPQAVAVFLSVVGSKIVWELARDVSRARQLGSYRLLEPLGKGGMGEVWRAEHGMLARPAAIKLIRPEALGQAEPEARRSLMKRFEREARLTAALSSPHTVQIYDYGVSSDSTFYYVMELLVGLDSEKLVERFGPVPPARAVYLLRQVCDSLAEAHRQGLVHRDIKPANVFLSRLGVQHDYVKVLDFGLVKAASNSGRAETVITQQHIATGTPAYMAPEVAMAEDKVDGRADLYAVGCLAHWLLTGKLVFDADNAMQMMFAHARSVPIAPSKATEQRIAPELDALVLALLAKHPADRPQTADEVRRLLEEVPLDDAWDRAAAERWWRANLPEIA